MVITAFNPETEPLEKSYLASSTSIGATTFEVKNSDRFVANDRILLGQMGTEAAEVLTVGSVSADGTSIVCTAAVFPHNDDDPVYKLRFDQVKFYRSTSGITGSYTVLVTQNLDVDNEDLTTKYDDTAGVAGYFYKVSMYHSISTLESALSDPIAGSGYTRNQVGRIIDEILHEVSDPNEDHVTRTELLGYFNDVNDDLLVKVAKPYDFLRTRMTLPRVQGQNYINFPTDVNGNQIMYKFDRMDYEFTDPTTTPLTDNTYTLKVWPEEEFRNNFQNNSFSSSNESDAITDISLDTALNRFRINPAPLTSAPAPFYLYYWSYFTELNSEGDTIQTPTPKIYKLYCKAMYYQKRSISDVTLSGTSTTFMNGYLAEKAAYKQLDRKDQGTPRGFRPVSDIVRNYRRT